MTHHLHRSVGRSLRMILFCGAAIGGTVAETASAFAADAPTATATVGEVIVTAQKRSEDNVRVPIALTALAGQEIAAIHASDMTDISFKVPNVTMSGGIISPTISIRGVSSQSNSNAGFPPAVGVYVNEVYQGRDPAFNTILNDVAQVEVLRGPQGTLYGKNTIGGAINIITNEPTNAPTAMGDVNIGNYDLFQARATVGGAIIQDQVMFRASAEYRHQEGNLTNSLTGANQNGSTAEGGRVDLVVNPTPDVKLRFSGDYYKDFGSGGLETSVVFPTPVPAALAALPVQNIRDGVIQNNSPDTAKRELGGVSARLDWQLPSVAFTSITSYRQYTSGFLQDSDGLSINGFDVGRNENSQNVSQEFRLTSKTDGPLTWIAGLYYYGERIQNYRQIHLGAGFPLLLLGAQLPSYTGENARTVSDQDSKSYAAFASGTYQLTHNIRLAGGLRWTHEDKKFFYHQFATVTSVPSLIGNFAVPIASTNETYNDGRVTGDGSISYDFDADETAYVKYSRGYKAGGFQTDVISPPFNPTDSLGFKPEFVDNYELGYKSYWFDHKLSLNAAAFYLNWTDKQEQVFTGLSFLIRNAASAHSEGAELELRARPIEALTLDANLGYLKTQYDSYPTNPSLQGKQFTGLPAWTGSVGAQYVTLIPGSGLQFYSRADVIYSSSSYTQPNASTAFNIAPLTTLKGRIGLQQDGGRYGIYLWGNNLTNQIVLGGGSIIPLPKAIITQRFLGIGRTFGIELRVRM